MTKEEHEALLHEIADGITEPTELLDRLQLLRDDYDESHGEREPDPDEPKDGYKSAYAGLVAKYKERFFSTPMEAKDKQRENVIEDGKTKTFEQLFKEREG